MMNMRFTEVGLLHCSSVLSKAHMSLLAWGCSVRQRFEGYNDLSGCSNGVWRCQRKVRALAADVNDFEP